MITMDVLGILLGIYSLYWFIKDIRNFSNSQYDINIVRFIITYFGAMVFIVWVLSIIIQLIIKYLP